MSTNTRGSNVKITSDERPYLGAYVDKFVSEKVQHWSKELKLMSAIGTTQPHAAFAPLTHDMTSKGSFLFRTVPHVREQVQD